SNWQIARAQAEKPVPRKAFLQSKGPEDFGASEVSARNEIEKRAKAPRCRFTDKMEAGNGRFEATTENRRAAYCFKRAPNCGAEKSVAIDVCFVPCCHNDMIHEAFRAIA